MVANTGSSPRVSTYTASRSPIFASTGSTTGRPRQSRMFSTGITGGSTTTARQAAPGVTPASPTGRGLRAGLLRRLVGDGQLVAADPPAAGEAPADGVGERGRGQRPLVAAEVHPDLGGLARGVLGHAEAPQRLPGDGARAVVQRGAGRQRGEDVLDHQRVVRAAEHHRAAALRRAGGGEGDGLAHRRGVGVLDGRRETGAGDRLGLAGRGEALEQVALVVADRGALGGPHREGHAGGPGRLHRGDGGHHRAVGLEGGAQRHHGRHRRGVARARRRRPRRARRRGARCRRRGRRSTTTASSPTACPRGRGRGRGRGPGAGGAASPRWAADRSPSR